MKKQFGYFLITAFLIALVSCSDENGVSSSGSPNDGGGSSVKLTKDNIRGWETRVTLSPSYFVGPAKESYRIAREIPEVIDGIYCYCHCKKNFQHKSLLTCHVDQHSSYCDICIKETLAAYEMHNKGMKPLEIIRAIDKRFSSYGRG